MIIAAIAIAWGTAVVYPAQQWVTDASPGNVIALENGAVHIEADAHTYALARRPLGRDLVRVSCALRAGVGRSWATSLFLYWGPGDWCQLGVVGDNGGGYYFTEMADGDAVEHDVGACRFDSVHYVAIELAEDCIRYYASDDGIAWRVLFREPRDEAKRGSPTEILVGKGYGTGRSPYARPHLANDYAERGPRTSCEIRDVRVEPTAAGLMRATSIERRELAWDRRDVLGDEVVAGGKDPTFARVAAIYPAMKQARETVSVRDHPDEFIVSPEGALLMTRSVGDPNSARVSFEAGDPPKPLVARRKGIVGDAPILTATSEREGLTFRQEAFGYSQGMSPDAPLWAYLTLAIDHSGSRARTVPVRLHATPDSLQIPAIDWQIAVPGRGARAIFAKIRFDVAGSTPLRIEQSEYAARRQEVVRYWDNVLDAGTVFRTPDPRVNSMRRMSLAYNFIDVDKRGAIYEPHDGAGFYEEIYGVSAALYCNALDLWGLHADSQRYLESLLTLVGPDGHFEVNSGLMDMGALLYAMSQHGLLTGNMAWIRRHAPVMRTICDWLLTKRRETMKLVDGKRPVSYGLLRGRAYCDYTAPVVDYLSDAYSCAGIHWTSLAFKRAGLDSDAARLKSEAGKYRADVLASMNAAVFVRNGVRMLPLEPETHRLLRDSGYRGCDYYGLVAPMLMECGFLRASSLYAQLITGLIEQHGGLTLGMAKFRDGIDHAYTYGYWLNLLERDDVPRVVLGLYGTLAYGMSRDTFAAVEVMHIKEGRNDPSTPHLYSGTQQLRLLRMMMVREDGGTLFLGQAAPREWLADGKRIQIAGAPTLFGPVSLDIRSHARSGYIDATVSAPKVAALRTVRLRLRCPPGTHIASATVDGKRAVVRGEDLFLRPTGRPMHVRARLQGAGGGR